MTLVSYEQERIGDFIQVHSGRRFYIFDPNPEDITIEDIAHSLANICRFTGHGDRFYSVGEHSIHCAMIARNLGHSVLQQLYCLLHDISEAVVNDLARPIKQNVPQYKAIEDKVMSTLWETVGLSHPTTEHYKVVKRIDNTMLVNEINQLMKNGSTDSTLEYEEIFVNLSNGYNAGEAKAPFLELYYSLYGELLFEHRRMNGIYGGF